ncbi:DUF4367 domain-containing protein [Bacillus carboniphilus]|uniref:DUF4367 domain-containing protein n=1 Tax=Bacillus carboniphilus TaxID=86663 RepID=A0ABY9JVF7_9BACI|nr:DUF4367 domain-containing protein [Bacillus carboniphilus]WLR42258.1 DUF4367 domain-containing protein [Bacillus carboniphilus]
MTNLKNSKTLYDVAEEIALDDFDHSDEQHNFSDTYTQKKRLFMEEIKMNNKSKQTKGKRKRLFIAAACLFIVMPTTAYGGVKVYDMIVEKQNYEVNVSVPNETQKNSESWYKLELGYLPEGMERMGKSDKYSYKDNYAQDGFSFIPWRIGADSDFQTLYSKDYEEKEINGNKAVIVKKDNGNDDNFAFDREVFVFFEEEGIMLQSYVGADVNEEEMINVLENLALEPTSEETSTVVDYDESYSRESVEAPTLIPLEKDSQRLFNVGEKIPVTIPSNEFEYDKLEFVIEKVEVFDSINDFKRENFNNVGISVLKEKNALNQINKLIPYKRDVYNYGDGKDSIDELEETQLVSPKFVYLTTTVKNSGKQATDEIYMHPRLQVLKSENNGWTYDEESMFSQKTIMTGEVDYLEPHGQGKGWCNLGNIQPGQIMKINLGYFVDEDKLDSIFLDAFNYSGHGETEDLNAEDRWWIDLRQ